MEIDFTQIVTLFDKDFKRIPIRNGVPEGKEYDKYKINGAKRFHAQIEIKNRKKKIKKNTFLFQCIEIGDITIWISNYLIYTPVYIYCTAESESLEIHTTLLGETQYRLKGFGWRRTKAGQYNLIYLPSIENEVSLRGFLTTFDLHLTKELLFKLAGEFPQLRPIVKSIQKREMNSLHNEFSNVSLKAIYQIVVLSALIESGKTQEPVTREAPLNLAKALIGIDGKEFCKYKYSYEDIESIHNASVQFMQYMNRQNILSLQLKKSHLTPDKFREGFKLIFNCTPKHFLLSKRMAKAKELYRQGYHLIAICEQTGYSKESHLEEAFFKYFGYPIGKLKRVKT